MDTFVPTYQGLSAIDLVRRAPAAPDRAAAFPFAASGRLSFYRARNAIYHLFRALVERTPGLTVLAPDYNSGNEILAIRAAGARVAYYPIDRRMQLDPAGIARLCDRHQPDLLYVIHYAGWPQPMPALMDLCRERGMLLVEDCALSLLSEAADGRPLGSFGDWSVFCLYKTLPLPNGALLVQNGQRLEVLERLQLHDAGAASVIGRTAELLVQRVRGRFSGVGAALHKAKRALGRAAGAMDVRRANVGDIGFNLDEVNLAMSSLSARLLSWCDMAAIRQRRIRHYRMLDALLDPAVVRVFPALPDGVCPLFFPILVADKHAAAIALRQRGVDALEFWNDSVESGAEMSADARFLRTHVLELPIHQDLTPRHIAYMARHVSELARGPADQPPPRLRRSAEASAKADAPRAETTRIQHVTDRAGLSGLERDWNDLLAASAADSPFLAWEWLDAWWAHLGGGASLRVTAMWADNRLVALAPWRRTPAGLGVFSRTEFLGTGRAGSDYLDVIIRRGYEAEALSAFGEILQRDQVTVRFDHVLEQSGVWNLASLLRANGWTVSAAPNGVCPVIGLSGHSWDSYLATLVPAHRANVRRRLRFLGRTFRTTFEPVVTEQQRRDALAALLGFHDWRFGASGGSTAFLTPSLRAFHDEVTRRALRTGRLRMYTLSLDGTTAAVMYGFGHNGRFYFYQHGFGAEGRRHSIGLALMARTIRAAIEEGMQEFDLLWGNESYKALWAVESRPLHRIDLFPPHVGGRLHRGLVEARRRLAPLARRVLSPGDHRAV